MECTKLNCPMQAGTTTDRCGDNCPWRTTANEDDLIPRAAAVRALASSNGDYLDALERFKRIPAVDAVPVVHARWSKARFEKTYAGYTKASVYYVCSACGKDVDDALFNYCPKCGAKMDGRDSE